MFPPHHHLHPLLAFYHHQSRSSVFCVYMSFLFVTVVGVQAERRDGGLHAVSEEV